MNYTNFLTGLTNISLAFQDSSENFNFSIEIHNPAYTIDSETGQTVLDESLTSLSIFNGNVRQINQPYKEKNDTQDRNRIYIEGNLQTTQYIDLYSVDRYACKWLENNNTLEGYFYPEKRINNSVAQLGRVDYALGQRIKGYVELPGG